MIVAFAFALLIGLPLLLVQAWAFIGPALAPVERGALRPLLYVAPTLFAAGVAFAYFLVLPPAVRFLQGSTTVPSTCSSRRGPITASN